MFVLALALMACQSTSNQEHELYSSMLNGEWQSMSVTDYANGTVVEASNKKRFCMFIDNERVTIFQFSPEAQLGVQFYGKIVNATIDKSEKGLIRFEMIIDKRLTRDKVRIHCLVKLTSISTIKLILSDTKPTTYKTEDQKNSSVQEYKRICTLSNTYPSKP